MFPHTSLGPTTQPSSVLRLNEFLACSIDCTITMLKVMSDHTVNTDVLSGIPIHIERQEDPWAGPKFSHVRWRWHQSTGMLDIWSYRSGWVTTTWTEEELSEIMLFKITHGLCDFPIKIFTSGHISRMNPCNYISRLHGLMHFSSVLSFTQFFCWTHFTPNRLLGLFLIKYLNEFALAL